MDLTSPDDRRVWRRFQVPLAGRLFGPSGGSWNCEVLDLSPGGARVQAADHPPPGPVILYIDRVGRIEAEMLGPDRGAMRLRFVCDPARREAITQMLARMIQGGLAQTVRLRRQNRVCLSEFQLIRDCGTSVPCDALNISLRGMSLRTAVRPPLGELVTVGHSRGRVVRHHDQGIAIEFLPPGEGVRLPAVNGGPG